MMKTSPLPIVLALGSLSLTAGASESQALTPETKRAPAPEPSQQTLAVVNTTETTEQRVKVIHPDGPWRERSLHIQNSRTASSGILWTRYAGSGAVGTFRLSFIGNGYTGTGFLCNSDTPCTLPAQEDKTDRISARFGLSVTPTSFMEAYLGVSFFSTHDDLGNPSLLQVLGDTRVGAKFFMPHQDGRFYSFGAELEAEFFSGSGTAGVDGDATSFGVSVLGTLDFSNLPDDDGIPLLFNLNAGYFYDNSGAIATDYENASGASSISRIERFGLNINRVDFVKLAAGLEGTFTYVRPFAEFSIDIPSNRNYTCSPASQRSLGDECLKTDARWSSTPSRVSFGLRGYPVLRGLALLAAADIGTGATSNFIEEVAPEMPWSVYVGAGYAFDVMEPVVHTSASVTRPSLTYVTGRVTGKGTGRPIADAIVRFERGGFPSMATGADGGFQSVPIAPGDHVLAISAEGYVSGQCAFVLPELPGGLASGTPRSAGASHASSSEANPKRSTRPGADYEAHVECQLDELPNAAAVVGTLISAASGKPVSGALVKITDPLHRELELKTDEYGGFRFENVPPGKSRLTVKATGYLTNVTEYDLTPRIDQAVRVSLYPTPKHVEITETEVRLKKEVHFQTGSDRLQPDSMALLEEAASALRSRNFPAIQVQGYTDDRGPAAFNLQLSQRRASAVRQALIALGVPADRLTAQGYGESDPIVPNDTHANRAKNRRVKLMIVEPSDGRTPD